MADEMTFREAIELARSISRRFERIERRPWGVEGAMIEMMKQVGELAKYVMSAEHYYPVQRDQMPAYRADLDTIGDELADVLFMLIRVADYYEIDLLEAHLAARRGEDAWLKEQGV